MKEKIVLITGASSGIGRETALKLKKEGCIVYAGARRMDLMKDLEQAGIHCMYLDVTQDSSMVDFINKVLSDQGRIDVLINNAGYGAYGSLEEVSMDEVRNQLEVNLIGLGRMCQLVIPNMRNRKSGTIINVSSIGGKAHEPLGSWYHASKFGVEGLSDCLRAELSPFNINVVVIEPGAITSEWGSIASKNLDKTSATGPYSKFVNTQSVTTVRGSTDIVSNAIWKAVKSKRPKTRYAVGPMAKLTVFSRWLLSDRMMDKIIIRLNHYHQ